MLNSKVTYIQLCAFDFALLCMSVFIFIEKAQFTQHLTCSSHGEHKLIKQSLKLLHSSLKKTVTSQIDVRNVWDAERQGFSKIHHAKWMMQ